MLGEVVTHGIQASAPSHTTSSSRRSKIIRQDIVSWMSREVALCSQPEKRVQPSLFTHKSGESYIGFACSDGYFIVADYYGFDSAPDDRFCLLNRMAYPIHCGMVFAIKQSTDYALDLSILERADR